MADWPFIERAHTSNSYIIVIDLLYIFAYLKINEFRWNRIKKLFSSQHVFHFKLYNNTKNYQLYVSIFMLQANEEKHQQDR